MKPTAARLFSAVALGAATALLAPVPASAGTPPATVATTSTEPRISLQSQALGSGSAALTF